MSNVERNDHLRSLLSKPLAELQQLEDNNELILSFSNGICQLMKKTGGAGPLLKAVHDHNITRDHDPFCNNSAGMLTYCQVTIFFKIPHQSARIDIGLYSETGQMRRQRNNYEWFALEAVIDF